MKKRKRLRIKSQERPEGRRLKSYRVRCAKTVSFYVDVDAYTQQEAEFIAEDYCCFDKGHDVWKPSGRDSACIHKRFDFEAEEG